MSWRDQANKHFAREQLREQVRRQSSEDIRARLEQLKSSYRIRDQQEEILKEQKWQRLRRMMRGEQ